MRGFANTTLPGLTLVLLMTAATPSSAGDTLQPGDFNFATFSVPGSTTLSVDGINDQGVVVGSYTIPLPSGATGATKGFIRSASGQLTTIVDPQDMGGSNHGFTRAIGINVEGVVVGDYFNTVAGAYEGLFDRNGMFTSFVFPGLPEYSSTSILGINDLGDFCGYYAAATSGTPIFTGYLSQQGQPASFLVSNSINTYAFKINDFDFTAGYYQDAASVFHGFVRDPRGNISMVDVPGASKTANQGTLLEGINNFGWVSGHFYDSSGNEHGFVGVPNGSSWAFFQIDVPGAVQTQGAGLNDFGAVAGHYVTSSGQQLGYIAYPR
jgi:hypothetical protein